MNVTCRENLKGCNLYKWKPLEYQTKWDYVKEETIYRGLEGLPLSLREYYFLVVTDYSVWLLEDNDDQVQYWSKRFRLS